MSYGQWDEAINLNLHTCADMLERIHYDLEQMVPKSAKVDIPEDEVRDAKQAKFQSYLKNGLQDETKKRETLYSSKNNFPELNVDHETIFKKENKPTGLIGCNLKFAAHMYYAVIQALGIENDKYVVEITPTMTTYNAQDQSITYRLKIEYDDRHDENYKVTFPIQENIDELIFKVECV